MFGAGSLVPDQRQSFIKGPADHGARLGPAHAAGAGRNHEPTRAAPYPAAMIARRAAQTIARISISFHQAATASSRDTSSATSSKSALRPDNLQNDVIKSGNGWSLTSDEYDSGATTEGFASYIRGRRLVRSQRFDTVPVGWDWTLTPRLPNRPPAQTIAGARCRSEKAFWMLTTGKR